MYPPTPSPGDVTRPDTPPPTGGSLAIVGSAEVVIEPPAPPTPRDVIMTAGHVTAHRLHPTATLDAGGCLVIPGLIDLQVNGAVGVDLTARPADWPVVGRWLASVGVTSWCPTLVSPDPAHVGVAAASLRPAPPGCARPLGWHVEGPYLSSDRRGAHPASRLRSPRGADVDRWARSAGIALVTLAPELSGAVDLVARLRSRGVVVALGHSTAGPAEVAEAIAAGATAVTHLFNAMGGVQARVPGLAGVALTDGALTCGMIADLVHVAPTTLLLAWKVLGTSRLFLVSDAVAPAGLPPGEATLVGNAGSGRDGVVFDGTSVRTRGGILAGASTPLIGGLANLARVVGSELPAVAATVTSTPARLLGLADAGHLRPGARGDATLIDATGRVVATVIAGEPAWIAEGEEDRYRPPSP